MCGDGWNGEDCSRRYFAPGGAATTALGDSAEDDQSGANFAIGPNGLRADVALDEAIGPEPRIDLNYDPAAAPAAVALPGMPLAAAAALSGPHQIAGGSNQATGVDQSVTSGGRGGGAMSPEAVSPGMALESAEVVALSRLDE